MIQDRSDCVRRQPQLQAVTMPPAPTIGSDELTAVIAEAYAQALLLTLVIHTAL